MRRMLRLFVIAIVVTGSVSAYGEPQQSQSDRFSVAFSYPARPGLLRVNIREGSITVRAYSGREVVISSSSRSSNRNATRGPAQPGGLRRIDFSAAGLRIEENNNEMSISAQNRP